MRDEERGMRERMVGYIERNLRIIVKSILLMPASNDFSVDGIVT